MVQSFGKYVTWHFDNPLPSTCDILWHFPIPSPPRESRIIWMAPYTFFLSPNLSNSLTNFPSLLHCLLYLSFLHPSLFHYFTLCNFHSSPSLSHYTPYFYLSLSLALLKSWSEHFLLKKSCFFCRRKSFDVRCSYFFSKMF